MVIERFRRGPEPVYARVAERGRLLPPGLVYLDSWVDERGLDRCFQLMETDEPALFEAWIAQWSDLAEFEVVPVVSSAEAARRARHQLQLKPALPACDIRQTRWMAMDPRSGAPRRQPAGVGRRTKLAALALLVLFLLILVRALEGGKKHPPSHSGDKKTAVIPAVESGLLPWQLSQPRSREVVMAGGSHRLFVPGGLRGSTHPHTG